jgi:hypothetical protein
MAIFGCARIFFPGLTEYVRRLDPVDDSRRRRDPGHPKPVGSRDARAADPRRRNAAVPVHRAVADADAFAVKKDPKQIQTSMSRLARLIDRCALLCQFSCAYISLVVSHVFENAYGVAN